MREKKVAILMGLLDGAEFLSDQLESLARQTHRNWMLMTSCDGSTDATGEILEGFVRSWPEHEVRMLDGPKQGFALNFLHLLSNTPDDVDYAAFCDQDDVWLPNKLADQIAQLNGIDGPAMICGRTIVVDTTLHEIGRSPLFLQAPHFANALVQNIGGGNTMLFNRAAVSILRQAAVHVERIHSHDWWAYQVLTAIGATVIYDPEPKVLYRQHGANVIGQNISLLARIKRLGLLFRGQFREWNDTTVESLAPIRHLLTPRNRRLLDAFVTARGLGPLGRLRSYKCIGLYRQTRAGQAALAFGFAFGLI